MSTIGYLNNIWSAVRGRPKGTGPSSRSVPNPFEINFLSGVGRPQPKLTMNYAKLRQFSESPIPRRAIDYIKNQISMLEWDIVPIDKDLGKEDPPGIDMCENVLRRPNHKDSWRTLVEQMVDDMLVLGHSAVEKRMWPGNSELPLVLYPFDGSSLNLYTNVSNSPNAARYAQIKSNGEIIDFTDTQMMYIRYNPRTSTPWGLGPLEVAAQSVDYLLNTQAYAGRMASNGTPDFILDLGEEIDQEQVKEVRMWWQNEVEGRGHTPIIGGTRGAKSISIGATGDQSLFLAWQGFLINQIANAFGLDSQKFGAVMATRATGDLMDDVSDEGAIRPLANSIAAAITRDVIHFLGFTDYEFKFRWTANYEDRKSLSAILQVYVQTNVMMLDEARYEIGLPPLPDGKGAMCLGEYTVTYGTPAPPPPTDGSGDNGGGSKNNPNSSDKVKNKGEKPTNQGRNNSSVKKGGE